MLCRAMSCRSPISCWPASAGSCRLGLRGRCLIPRLVAHRVLAVLLGDEHQLIGDPHERVHRLGRHEVGGNADTGGETPAVRRHDARDGLSQLRSEEHTSELQSLAYLVCRLLLEKKKKK